MLSRQLSLHAFHPTSFPLTTFSSLLLIYSFFYFFWHLQYLTCWRDWKRVGRAGGGGKGGGYENAPITLSIIPIDACRPYWFYNQSRYIQPLSGSRSIMWSIHEWAIILYIYIYMYSEYLLRCRRMPRAFSISPTSNELSKVFLTRCGVYLFFVRTGDKNNYNEQVAWNKKKTINIFTIFLFLSLSLFFFLLFVFLLFS